jgi:cell division transport system ATP-binding protein
MSGKMVRLNRVGKKYSPGRIALQDVSFDLLRGEFAYITGGNGAGKTTLLKLLFAQEKASNGSIFVNNRDLSALGNGKVYLYRREVGFVFQDFKLLPDLTVFENVALPLEIRRMTPRETEFRVKGVLSLVGLGDRVEDYPQMLSGGEQQRVAIARAMVGKPTLLLADEPTGNLDSKTAREIMTLFNEIREMGTTVLIATHDETLMDEFPARVIELFKGRIASDTRGNT